MESVQNREKFIHRLFTGVNVLGARFKCLETILETICYRYYEPVVRQAPNISEDRSDWRWETGFLRKLMVSLTKLQ